MRDKNCIGWLIRWWCGTSGIDGARSDFSVASSLSLAPAYMWFDSMRLCIASCSQFDAPHLRWYVNALCRTEKRHCTCVVSAPPAAHSYASVLLQCRFLSRIRHTLNQDSYIVVHARNEEDMAMDCRRKHGPESDSNAKFHHCLPSESDMLLAIQVCDS